MLSAESSALVAGGMRAPAPRPPQLANVRITRAVMLAGAPVAVGTELALERWFAAELISAGKAEPVAPAPSQTQPPPAAKAAKEKSRAEQ
jgi:hypothetical protein